MIESFETNILGVHMCGQHYSQLKNANVRRWGPLYVDQPTNEDDPTTYSIFGYTWAFKTWILESFRVTAIWYFDRFNWYPRVAAWSKKKGRFLAEMVVPFFEGYIPAARLTPDDNDARSDWWISSKAYFDGFIDQVERVPFDLSRQNMYEIPSDIYRQFVEQKIKLERNRKDVDDIKEQMLKFREDMNARPVRQENTVPINVGQHYGFSDFSQFQSMQLFNMGTPSNFQTPMRSQPGSSDWQRQMPEQSASHYWQPSPQPGSYYSFGQVPSHIAQYKLEIYIDHIGVNFVMHKYIFQNVSLAEMMNHVITEYSSENEGIIRQETQNDYIFDQMVEWAEQEHFEYEETKVSCPKIDLGSMLIHNNRSKEESFGGIILEEQKRQQEESLSYLYQMQKRKNKNKLNNNI
nr:phospholipase-like protein [Tanacetum cinerariifolium]